MPRRVETTMPAAIYQESYGINDAIRGIKPSRFVIPRMTDGRVIWVLKENTPEQNDALAIQIVQTLFLEKFPDFDELFPRGEDRLIPKEKRDEAREFIRAKIGKKKDLSDLVKSTPLQSRHVSTFAGGQDVLFQKSFSPWGLNFEEDRDEDGLPKVRYTSFGRMRWKVKGNTDEQNLALGIGNVQAILLEAIPELRAILLSSPERVVRAERIEEAKEMIRHHLQIKGGMKGVLPEAVSMRGACDYFEGSSATALTFSLVPWGINLEFGDIKSKNDYWKSKSEAEVIEVMQRIWLERFPEFREQFPSEEDGKIAKDKKESAKAFVLSKIGSVRNFISIFGTGLIYNESVPSFEGRFSVAIKKMFTAWGLTFKIRDFRNEAIWRNKSDEEMLDIVRTIFLEEFPQFEAFFVDRENKIIAANRLDEARKFVLEKVGAYDGFTSLFGGVQTRNESFERKYSMVVQKAFAPFGLIFTPKDFDPRTLPLKGKSEIEIIQEAHNILFDAYPAFVQLVQQHREGLVSTEDLKQFVLQVIPGPTRFIEVFRSVFLVARSVPYFDGDFMIAMNKIFAPFDVVFQPKDFKRIRGEKVDISSKEAREELQRLLEVKNE